MPRGIDQKIFFPIRAEHEDYDRQRIEDYIATLKKGKENKGAEFYISEGKKGELKGMFIVVMEKAEAAKAIARGFNKK